MVSDIGSATANILFDESAQCSFVSMKLGNALKLLPGQNENIFGPFGVDASTLQCLDVTTINSKL